MENLKKLQDKGTHFFYQFIIILFIVSLLSTSLVINALADHAGDALEFDGVGEYVLLGDTGNLMGVSSWTSAKSVSLWLKPGMDAAPATHPTSGEMILGVDYPQIFGISRAVFNGRDRVWVWNADSNGIDVIGIPYTAGEWMHIAMVHTGNVLYAYRNGELVGTKVSGSTYAPANGRVYLAGSGRTNAALYFGGQLDEVQIWNTGLGSGEMGTWWDQEVSSAHPNWSNLAAYYQMSDGAGVVLTDDRGNGRTGTLLGGMGDESWVLSGALEHTTEPTATAVAVTQTATPIAPTFTPTPLVPTSTPVVPTATATPGVPTATPIPPTATLVVPTATIVAATQTATPIAPTFTPTPLVPTSTPVVPTATAPSPTSTPTQITSGTVDHALEFDGVGEYVLLGDTGNLMGVSSWTSAKSVSLWLKPGMDAAPATHPTSGEMILGVDYPQIFGISRAVFNGRDRVWVWNADSNGIDVIGIPYTAGEWMHIAMVHTGNVLYAYRNGELVGTKVSGSTYAPADGRVYLAGSGRTNAALYFGGQLDEVQIWNTGLGSGEMGAWWDQEVSSAHPNWSNLAAYYQMSDGAGVVLTDDRGNGRTGTLLGGMGDESWVLSGALEHTTEPTATAVAVTQTATPIAPTFTPTPLVPTSTPVVPTATATPGVPTATPIPPTATTVTPNSYTWFR